MKIKIVNPKKSWKRSLKIMMIKQDYDQFTPWKNEPIFEKLFICHICCHLTSFFMEQHKKGNGREKEENMALCFDVKISYVISIMLKIVRIY